MFSFLYLSKIKTLIFKIVISNYYKKLVIISIEECIINMIRMTISKIVYSVYIWHVTDTHVHYLVINNSTTM